MEDRRSKAMETGTQDHRGQGKHQGHTEQGEQQTPTLVTRACSATSRMSTRESGQGQCRHPTSHRPKKLKNTT